MTTGAVLLVHDVVHDFLDETPGLDGVLRNVAALVAAAHDSGMPVVFAAPDRDAPGAQVPASVGIAPGDRIVRKPRWGAFFGTTLAADLLAAGHETVVVCGISLAGGVETTVRDAHNHGLRSIVVADACVCRAIPDQGWGALSSDDVGRVVLSILAQRFARVVSTAELCAEMQSSR